MPALLQYLQREDKNAILFAFMLHQDFGLAVSICINTCRPSSTDSPKA